MAEGVHDLLFPIPGARGRPLTFPFLDSRVPIAFAHRGGSKEGENVLVAFEAARGLGYRYIETDVRTTGDGVPLVFHDPDLRRLTGVPAQVHDLSAAEVAQLKLPGGETVPTLAEALDAFPDLRFNIDLKDAAGVEPVVRVVRRSGALERVCVTSFSERRVATARRLLGPAACTGLGVAGAMRFAFTSFLPGGGRSGGAAVLQLPLHWHGLPVVTSGVVARAHEAGLAVHVWTLNDATSIAAALDAGVDGVMTDRLELLKEILIERDLWDESA